MAENIPTTHKCGKGMFFLKNIVKKVIEMCQGFSYNTN